MLSKMVRFFKEYKQLAFVVVTFLLALLLYLTDYRTAANWVLGVSALINVIPLVWNMIEDVRSGKYGIDILAATAIITSVLLREYWAGMVVVLMLTGGVALENYAERRAKKELSALLDRKPKMAHVIRKGKTYDIGLSEVKVGDKVVVLPGEVVPVDGHIIENASSFDESDLTGESLPVYKERGEQILSGAINIEGAVTIKALHTAKDSQYEQIIKLVRSAAASQSPFVRLADRYSIPFTVTAYLIAGSVWIISGDPIRFLQVIIVATPCPLLLAAPIALISGMSRAAKHGIIVKTGSALERLAEIETIAFDKTGTLTKGFPVVDKITSYNKFSQDEVLKAAASLEQSSGHILAKAITTAAADKKIKVNAAKQVKEISGHGLSGRLQGKTILVGRLKFIETHGVDIPEKLKTEQSVNTATYVAINDVLAGVITFNDELRADSKEMLSQLNKLGIKHSLMVTGDNQSTASAIAKKLGIEKVIADCLPGDKIRALENVPNKPVAFVGDGVNDAPVLTASDVGIALGARGSTAASESADIVIMPDDISKVATAVSIAKRTFYIGRQSILIGIFISIGLMGAFATGKFKPLYGALLQELVDVVVIFNALRAHGGTKRRGLKTKISR
jgi:heavy metal translocating P-type ATPase